MKFYLFVNLGYFDDIKLHLKYKVFHIFCLKSCDFFFIIIIYLVTKYEASKLQSTIVSN